MNEWMAIHMVMREDEATGSFVVGRFFFPPLIFLLFLNCVVNECSVTFLPVKYFIKAERQKVYKKKNVFT